MKKTSKRLFSFVSTLLIAATSLSIQPTIVQAGTNTPESISGDTLWYYSEENVDPAGDPQEEGYERLAWTTSNYDDSSWKTAKGSFGAKRGKQESLGGDFYPETLLTQYIEGTSTDIPTYFFRTDFRVDDLEAVESISGKLYYDDAAIVYINGHVVGEYSVPAEGYPTTMSYGGSNMSEPLTGNIGVTDKTEIQSLLVEGDNTLAVELHQGRESSSDIYFHFESLTMSTEAPVIEQDTLAMTLGSDESEMNFNWYATTNEPGTLVLDKADNLVGDTFSADAVSETTSVDTTSRGGYYKHFVTVNDLEPATEYAYQLINNETKSQVYRFKTNGNTDNFSFFFMGDPQIGAGSTDSDAIGWANTLKTTMDTFPDTDFVVSAGDQVNSSGSEEQYQKYLNNDTIPRLPMATTVGNHDTSSAAYSEHFELPNVSQNYGVTTAGSDYWYIYENTLFMDLNSNEMSAAQHKAFMEEAIAANPDVTWKVVVFHHSIYSAASHAVQNDILDRRGSLSQVFNDLDIDTVLMGHDHVYVRSYMMNGTTPMTDASLYNTVDSRDYASIDDPEGVLYVTANSASGSKYYTVQNMTFDYAAVINQERVPNVTRVIIEDEALTVATYRVTDMSLVDTFTINKTAPVVQPTLDSVQIQLSSTTLKSGATVTATLSGTMSDQSPAQASDLMGGQWSSSNTNVIQVSSEGVITAVNAGSADVTVSIAGLSAKVTLTVEAKSSGGGSSSKPDRDDDKDKEADEEATQEVVDQGERTKEVQDGKTIVRMTVKKTLASTVGENTTPYIIHNEDVEADRKEVVVDTTMVKELMAKGHKTIIDMGSVHITAQADMEDSGEGNVVYRTDVVTDTDTMPLDNHSSYQGGVVNIDVLKETTSNQQESVMTEKNPLTIALPYNSATAASNELLAVYYYDEDANQWSYIGGRLNEDGRIEIEANKPGNYAVIQEYKTFEDVTHDWSKQPIQVLSAQHIVDGNEMGVFNPESNVTRGEFVKMLVQTIGLESVEGNMAFDDVNDEDWYAESVQTAFVYGILEGDNGEAKADADITREEMAVLLVRTMKVLQPEMTAEALSFDDATDIASWARDAVAIAAQKGIVQGTGDGNFDPLGTGTREQAATMVYRLWKQLYR